MPYAIWLTCWNILFYSILLNLFLQLRSLNNAVFPVRYNDAFYKSTFSPENSALSKFAYENDVVVGGVSCRFEQSDPAILAELINENPHITNTGVYKRIYIMTLG